MVEKRRTWTFSSVLSELGPDSQHEENQNYHLPKKIKVVEKLTNI